MGSSLLIVIILHISTVSGVIEISFEKGVPRLNNSLYCDYYLACHTEGETLQWRVGNNIFNYSGQSTIGSVFYGSASNCNYTATLLSLKPLSSSRSFKSALILTCQSNFNMSIICSDGSLLQMISIPEKELNLMAETTNNSIYLEHVLSQNLVNADNSTCTNVFVCGVNNSFMDVQLGNIMFLFTEFDFIGRERNEVQGTSVQQAILIDKEPYRLVVAMFIVGSEVMNVTCGFSQNIIYLSGMECRPVTTMPETTGTMESESSTVGESSTIASEDDNSLPLIWGLSITFGVLLSVAVIVIIIIIVFCFIRRPVSKSSSLQEQELCGREMNGSGPVDNRNRRQKKNENWLDEEYEKLESEPESKSSCDIAKSNSDKNRFPNFYPYDQHRVILKTVGDTTKCSDYINATRIEGTGLPGAYFATQDPLPDTVDDFWRMVYDYNVSFIVLLTSYIERGKNENCYWQEQMRQVPYLKGSKLKITIKDATNFSDYEIRKIEIEYKSKKHHVIHYQFLGWPPREVPVFPTSFIQFICRVKNDLRDNSAPIVVQSSSGIGRSGAFITISAMMNKIKEGKEQPCSIYEFVHDLRSRSRFMVSSLTQYKFINNVLEEIKADGDTSLEDAQLRTLANNLNDDSNDEYSSKMEEQFKMLNEGSRIPDIEEQSEAQKDYNKWKNRSQNRVPYDGDSRVQLKCTHHSGSDYINASFINGYRQPKQYIATQAPLPKTKNDFWRMIWEHGYRIIVCLCQLKEEEIQTFWPENGKSLVYGKIKVETGESRQLHQNCKTTRIRVSRGETSQPLSVTLYEYDGWPESNKPLTTADIRDLISSLKQTSHSSDKIVVMCSDGVDRTGAFITIHAMMEKFETEERVDIFQFIKLSRINRAHVVTTLENFKFCHAVLADYVEQIKK